MALRAEAGTLWPSKRADKRLTTHGWKLHKGDGERTFSQHINFAKAFPTAPSVFVALSAIDLLNEADFRVDISAEKITDSSMDIRFQTSRHSHVWSASASYFAFEKSLASAEPDRDDRSARVETGRYTASRALAGWELSAGGGERKYTGRMLFSKPFVGGAAPPRVIVCIAGFDATKDEDLRIRVYPEDVNRESFKLVVCTWGRSALTSVTVSWLAVEESLANQPAGCSLRVGTQQFRSSDAGYSLDKDEGDRETTRKIDFTRPLFENRPRAIVCLSSLDISSEHDNRCKAIETGISREGFNLTLGTWSDTVVWGANTSWIAFLEGDVYRKPAVAPAVAPADEPAAKRQKQNEGDGKVVVAAAAAAGGGGDVGASECKICFDAKINTVIIPCGHLCVCYECSKLIKPPGGKCPICRSKVERIIKAFLA